MQITVQEPAGDRLDVFLTRELPELSRSRIQALLKSGHILLNDATTRPRARVAPGDRISVCLPPPEPCEILPRDIPLNVLHEDDHLIVIDKPGGLVVHPAAGNPDGTLVNALLHHCRGRLSGIGGVQRPGIVHRLDKDTSGCLVAAKSDLAHQSLANQFARRQTTKLYLAAASGVPPKPSGTIFTNIGRHPVHRQKMTVLNPGAGRPAITDYYLLSRRDDLGASLILCHLHTGRTHQIRVHLRHLGCPVLGDLVYGPRSSTPISPGRLMLHAWRLAFTHPLSGAPLSFEAPIPDAFTSFLPPPSLLASIRQTHPDGLSSLLTPPS